MVVKECEEVEKQAQFLEKELIVEDHNEVSISGNQVNQNESPFQK